MKYHRVAATLHKLIADTNVCVRATLGFNSLCNHTVLVLIDFFGGSFTKKSSLFSFLSSLYFP